MSKKQYEILWKDNIPYRLHSGMTFAFLYYVPSTYLVDIQFIEIKAGRAHIRVWNWMMLNTPLLLPTNLVHAIFWGWNHVE